MATEREIQLVDAALKAAAEIHDAEAAGQGHSPFSSRASHQHYAKRIRSLDRAAIVASVPDHVNDAVEMVSAQEQVEPTDAEIWQKAVDHGVEFCKGQPILKFARALLSANQGGEKP